MSNKYGESVGKFELNVGGFDKELTPKVGEGRKFIKIISKAEENKDIMFDEFANFMSDMIARDYPPESDIEKEELALFVDRNLMNLLNEIMVAFGMTTRAELEKQKKDLLQVGKKIVKS